MKLDKKNTVLIGFAFLSICAFWQMYDNLVPLMLTNTFHMNEVVSGAIMAADNVLALFLLPLFGALSDKCRSPLGRRRPFILFGSLAAIVLMMALPVLNDSYRAAPSTGKMVAFVVVLGALLVAMGTYRSPAVALMPDVTPKPLRSKANAVINLMGAVGGIIYLLLTTFLYTDKNADASYLPLFSIVAGIILLALIVLMTLVNEPKLVTRQRDYEKQHPEEAAVKKSLGFLLCSIALWFVAYNGVTTWFTTYAQNQWSMTLSQSSMCLTIATAGAIVSYNHMNNKIGVLVSFATGKAETAQADAFKAMGADVAMHIAAMNPVSLDKDSVPAEVAQHELEIYKAQAAESGKPENIQEKIAEGRMAKFYKENCLLAQDFVKDPDKTVEQYVNGVAKELGDEIKVVSYVRMALGE